MPNLKNDQEMISVPRDLWVVWETALEFYADGYHYEYSSDTGYQSLILQDTGQKATNALDRAWEWFNDVETD